MVKLPKKLKVGGLIYQVILKDFEDNPELDGHHSGTKLVIEINSNETYDDQYIMYIFIHELIHAIDLAYTDNMIDEDTVILLSKGLLNFIRWNDFDFDKNIIPSSIIICGTRYKVIYPYIPEGYDNQDTISEVSPFEMYIRLNNTVHGNKINIERIKIMFIECVIDLILKEYNLKYDDEEENFNVSSFTTGVYQVIKDNQLDKVIRRLKK